MIYLRLASDLSLVSTKTLICLVMSLMLFWKLSVFWFKKGFKIKFHSLATELSKRAAWSFPLAASDLNWWSNLLSSWSDWAKNFC